LATLANSNIEERYYTGGARQVWVTIDDGPDPNWTPVVLRALERFKIKALFFVVGENAELYPSLIEEAFSQGHRIGNHSYNHPHLTTLSRQDVEQQITRTTEIISKWLTGDRAFRPPYGDHNAMVDEVVSQLGYRSVFWTVDTNDWDPKNQPDRWVDGGVEQISGRDNSVVLIHDICPTTASNLERFLGKVADLGKIQFGSPHLL